MPSLHVQYGRVDALLTESATISRFLADAFPSHLIPTAGSVESALARARIDFFVDTYEVKIHDHGMGMMRLTNDAEREAHFDTMVYTIKSEIEPMLEDAAPFFAGSKTPTLAEVLIGPFVLRAHTYSRSGLTPPFIHERYSRCPVYWKWAQEVIENITSFYVTWDEKEGLASVKVRMAEHRAMVRKQVEAERAKIEAVAEKSKGEQVTGAGV